MFPKCASRQLNITDSGKIVLVTVTSVKNMKSFLTQDYLL